MAIGRAIVRDPKVYLFDEPLSNLDAALRVATRIEIAQLKEAMPESTMIYVTHDQVEAMTLATRIVVLANKGIAQVGTPLDLYERPENEFVAQFIGSPAMNLLPGEIIETGGRDHGPARRRPAAPSARRSRRPRPDKGRKVNVGIRPEDMVATEGDDHAFAGEVEIVEALGEVTQLYFKRAAPTADPVIAKLPGIHTGMRGTPDPPDRRAAEGASLRQRPVAALQIGPRRSPRRGGHRPVGVPVVIRPDPLHGGRDPLGPPASSAASGRFRKPPRRPGSPPAFADCPLVFRASAIAADRRASRLPAASASGGGTSPGTSLLAPAARKPFCCQHRCRNAQLLVASYTHISCPQVFSENIALQATALPTPYLVRADANIRRPL